MEENNHIEHLLTSIGYFLWPDGKLGAYVRYVADGQRFGFHEENILEALEIPLGEDVYICPQCGKETPSPHPVAQAFRPEGVSSPERLANAGRQDLTPEGVSYSNDDEFSSTSHEPPVTSYLSCPKCGPELTDANLRKAERVTVPRLVGSRRV